MESYHSSLVLKGIISMAEKTSVGHNEDPFKVAKELSISLSCIVAGAALFLTVERLKVVGVFLVFFGAQTGMCMYMEAVFSSLVVDEELGHHGFGAPFLVTAMQQFFSFIIFWIVYGISLGVGYPKEPYQLRKLTTQQEWIAVLCFSVSFTANVALNNFSLSLIPLTLNLIIRSCLPLTTFLSQWASIKIATGEGKPIKPLEISLMLLGVAMAGVAVLAKVGAQSDARDGSESSGMVLFGVCVCILSLFSGSVNLALAGVLGTWVKLDPLATVVYNSLPATFVLAPVILCYPHPVNWPNVSDYMTDWEITKIVASKSVSTLLLASASSVLSLAYNVLQIGIVQYLTATHVAFAGNFNKAATIPLALLVGLDRLPPDKWGILMVLPALGSIGAFAAYNMVTASKRDNSHVAAPTEDSKELQQLVADEEGGSSLLGPRDTSK